MNIELISEALTAAERLLHNEIECVDDESLQSEYQSVITLLHQAIAEINLT